MTGRVALVLHVDEGSGELDEGLVKEAAGPFFLEPEILEHIVRLVEVAAVEADEPAGIAGVEAGERGVGGGLGAEGLGKLTDPVVL